MIFVEAKSHLHTRCAVVLLSLIRSNSYDLIIQDLNSYHDIFFYLYGFSSSLYGHSLYMCADSLSFSHAQPLYLLKKMKCDQDNYDNTSNRRPQNGSLKSALVRHLSLSFFQAGPQEGRIDVIYNFHLFRGCNRCSRHI